MFHISHFGSFGRCLEPYADTDGYVPEPGDPMPAGWEGGAQAWKRRVEEADRATREVELLIAEWRYQASL